MTAVCRIGRGGAAATSVARRRRKMSLPVLSRDGEEDMAERRTRTGRADPKWIAQAAALLYLRPP